MNLFDAVNALGGGKLEVPMRTDPSPPRIVLKRGNEGKALLHNFEALVSLEYTPEAALSIISEHLEYQGLL